MQVIQNKGLRYIKGIKKGDKIKMETLHKELDIDPLNVRIDRMANKALNKMKEQYHFPKNQVPTVNYKYSDFSIQTPPSRTKRKSMALRIEQKILKPRGHKSSIKIEPPVDKWKPPTPIYTG